MRETWKDKAKAPGVKKAIGVRSQRAVAQMTLRGLGVRLAN
jgi:hypothetical protein